MTVIGSEAGLGEVPSPGGLEVGGCRAGAPLLGRSGRGRALADFRISRVLT